tara:strand:- start:615 stop:737 length:123 start_codon:yes stop_codon:yes gene_type:complete
MHIVHIGPEEHAVVILEQRMVMEHQRGRLAVVVVALLTIA